MEDRLKTGQMSFGGFLMQVKVMQKGASVQAMLGKMGGGQIGRSSSMRAKKMQRYGTSRLCCSMHSMCPNLLRKPKPFMMPC